MRKMIAAAAAMMLSFTVISAKGTTVHAEDAMGTGGRIYFNNGYSVALNWADPFDAYAVQSITDAQDSAVEESYGGSTLIADHNTQGFDVIKQYGVGSTMKCLLVQWHRDASGWKRCLVWRFRTLAEDLQQRRNEYRFLLVTALVLRS